MECWNVLQLPEDADERTIKRSYARLLKSCRPDDDAAGFQRLREAYEQALSEARWRADREPHERVEVPVVEPTYANLNDLAELMDIRPLQPAPYEAPAPDPAHALLSGLTTHNLDARWAQASNSTAPRPSRPACCAIASIRPASAAPSPSGRCNTWTG